MFLSFRLVLNVIYSFLGNSYFIHLPMKMEPIVSSETSAIRTQTPGNYPKRNKLHLYSCVYIYCILQHKVPLTLRFPIVKMAILAKIRHTLLKYLLLKYYTSDISEHFKIIKKVGPFVTVLWLSTVQQRILVRIYWCFLTGNEIKLHF